MRSKKTKLMQQKQHLIFFVNFLDIPTYLLKLVNYIKSINITFAKIANKWNTDVNIERAINLNFLCVKLRELHILNILLFLGL